MQKCFVSRDLNIPLKASVLCNIRVYNPFCEQKLSRRVDIERQTIQAHNHEASPMKASLDMLEGVEVETPMRLDKIIFYDRHILKYIF